MKRRTWLRSKKPLKPGQPLVRRTPLREVSAKRAAVIPMTRRPKDTGPDRATRDLVLERDSGCVICGKGPYGLQVHHRKPRRMGGRSDAAINGPANLVSVCREDHEWLESNRAEALDMGLLLHESEDPERVPVLHFLYGAVFLLTDGGVQPAPHADGGDAA